jgi:hypothetical protein
MFRSTDAAVMYTLINNSMASDQALLLQSSRCSKVSVQATYMAESAKNKLGWPAVG